MSLFGSLRSDLVAPRPAAHTAGQQRVLDAFEALIIGEGFSHLTVAEIAAKLHCSRRTLYDIAPTKDDLVVLAVARFVDRLLEAMRDAAAAAPDPVDALSALTQLGVDTSAAFSPAFEIDAMHNARTRAEVGRFDVGLIATIRGLIDDAIRTGQVQGGNQPDPRRSCLCGCPGSDPGSRCSRRRVSHLQRCRSPALRDLHCRLPPSDIDPKGREESTNITVNSIATSRDAVVSDRTRRGHRSGGNPIGALAASLAVSKPLRCYS